MRVAQEELCDLAKVRRHRKCLLLCQRLLTHLRCRPGSLAKNALCGVSEYGQGTYTTEGITKLCEGLNESAVTSLKCAAAPKCLLLCQRPLTLLTVQLCTPRLCSLSQNMLGPYGGAALGEALKVNSTLQSLM